MGYDLVNVRDRWSVDLFRDVRRLSNGDLPAVVFDVGANVGEHAWHFLEEFDNPKIYAFEPIPEVFEILVSNTKHTERIEAIDTALGSSEGSSEMFVFRDRLPVSSLLRNPPFTTRFLDIDDAERVPVRVTTMDAFARSRNITRIDFIKIDTEGFELEVLKGAKELLANQSIRFVYCEFNTISKRPGVGGGNLTEIDTFLAERGFDLVGIYTDYLVPKAELFAVRNALFCNLKFAAGNSPSDSAE